MRMGVRELVLPRFHTVGRRVVLQSFLDFNIVVGNVMGELNADLVAVAGENELEDAAGLSVSNAGGSLHSKREFFNKFKGRESVDKLWEVAVGVVNFVEEEVGRDCGVEGGTESLPLRGKVLRLGLIFPGLGVGTGSTPTSVQRGPRFTTCRGGTEVRATAEGWFLNSPIIPRRTTGR